jgi:NAD(P)-dependent dehydrogenase (short-subunit alcohol dehydrogenase family)
MTTKEVHPKAVLVTGASSGIGQATALELDRRGFRVFAGVRSDQAEAELRKAASPGLEVLRIDITHRESIELAGQRLEQELSSAGLWGLVNNAGVALTGPIEFVEPETWQYQFGVNFFGHVELTKRLIPLLRQARGRIVNISSISGRISPPYFGPYTCSKRALEAFSDVLRVELRRFGIRVIVVEPGNTQTPIWQRAQKFAEEALSRWQPQLAALPEEVRAIYEADFAAMRKAAERMARTGGSVDRVVQTICKALTVRNPRSRYPVGWWVKAAFQIFAFLPDRWRDRLLCWVLGLP